MALREIMSKKLGPYEKLPLIEVKVLQIEDDHKVVSWEFNPKPAMGVIKKNKLVIISDGHSVAKITLFEGIGEKLYPNGSFVIKGYVLRGHTPPYMINITRQTEIFRGRRVEVSEDLVREGEALLHPPAPLRPVASCVEGTGLVTVQAEVVEVAAAKGVTVGRDTVPMKALTIKEEESTCRVTLWREAAMPDLKTGDVVRATHLKARASAYGLQLQSTKWTKIEVQKGTANVDVTIIGVTDVDTKTVKVVMEDGKHALCSVEMWQPFEAALEVDRLKVTVTKEGDMITSIVRV